MARNYIPTSHNDRDRDRPKLSDRQLKSLKLMLIEAYPNFAIRERFGLTDTQIRSYAEELGVKRRFKGRY